MSIGRFYRDLFKHRQQGDYDLRTFTREEVEAWLEQAEAFIGTITELIEEKLSEKYPENQGPEREEQ